MFLCNACYDYPEKPNIQNSSIISSVSLQSDQNLNEFNTVTIKKSNYQKHLAKTKKIQFTDPQFPPISSSLQYKVNGRQIIWRRIGEIVPNFQLFKEKIIASEVYYGNMGDKYFLPTIAALARYPNRIRKIFSLSSNVSQSNIYLLLVKKGGEVHQIFIDDYVPVYKDSGRPVFCKANGQQVWPMLLEKAWAKLKGSYGAIQNGCPHQVLSTFCIGPCSSYDLTQAKIQDLKKIEQILKQAYLSNFVMCATSAKNLQQSNIKEETVYPITAVYSNGYIKISNYLQPLRQSRSIQRRQSRINFQNVEGQQGERTFKVSQIKNYFSRIDISHEDGTFNTEFQSINCKNQNIFVEFQVTDNEQAYISVQKSNSFHDQGGYIRMILAKKISSQMFQFEQVKQQTHYPDCFIHIKLKKGTHTLLIMTNEKQNLTVTYSWKNTGRKTFGVKKITNTQIWYPVDQFLQSVFQSHSQNVQVSHIFDPVIADQWIKRVDLFHKCGLGYLVCGISLNSRFHFKITIDKDQIRENGFEIIGNYEPVERIYQASQRIFIFTPTKLQLEAEFPPKGFSIMKVI